MGLPALSVTKPESPDVVTPWAIIDVVAAKARATAPAKVHLQDGNIGFIGLELGLTFLDAISVGKEIVYLLCRLPTQPIVASVKHRRGAGLGDAGM
jgi:hypothetical protein